MSDMPGDEFSLYVDMLFVGGRVCSSCGVQLSTGNRPKRNDTDWAAAVARDAIAKGWRQDRSSDTRVICPTCSPPTKSIMLVHDNAAKQ